MKTIIEKEELSQKDLKKLLHYDEVTGIFTWRERPLNMFKSGKRQLNACNSWNTKFSNKIAGGIWTDKKSKTSYLRINISSNGKTKNYKAHRLVFLYLNGHLPPESVDHIDGNGLNNRRNNLREVSHQENHKNRPMNSNNTSGYVGVIWFKRNQKWRAQIFVNGKNIYGSYFLDKADAIQERKELEKEYGFHKNHGRKR